MRNNIILVFTINVILFTSFITSMNHKKRKIIENGESSKNIVSIENGNENYCPSVDVQNSLIEYYEKVKPLFKKANDIVKRRQLGRQSLILDRLDTDELKSEYLQGISILHYYGNVSMGRFEVNTNFLRAVFSVHNIPNVKLVCRQEIISIFKDLVNEHDEKDFPKLVERINIGLSEFKVDLEAVKKYYYKTVEDKKINHKTIGKNEEEEYDNNSYDWNERPEQKIGKNYHDDEEDTYWEDWNRSTM